MYISYDLGFHMCTVSNLRGVLKFATVKKKSYNKLLLKRFYVAGHSLLFYLQTQK